MRSLSTARRSSLLAAVFGCAALTACSTPPPPPVVYIPPPPPSPAAFALSPAVIKDAAAYEAYMRRTAAITPNFTNGDDVAAALKSGESYDPRLLLRGEVAYAAMAALQDPAFAAEIRSYGVDPAGRRAMIERLDGDSNFVNAFKNAPTAAGLAQQALMAQGQALQAAGLAMKQAAYDLQHQPWSTQFVQNRDQRLADAKILSVGTPDATVDEADRMRRGADGSDPLPFTGAPVAKAPYSSVIVRGLNIAALALLGAAGDDQTAQLEPLFDDPRDQTCLSDAKLSLYECLAGAKPHYEDVFCLGQHVMLDTAQCVRISAGELAPVFTMTESSTETPYAKPKSKGKHKPRRGAS